MYFLNYESRDEAGPGQQRVVEIWPLTFCLGPAKSIKCEKESDRSESERAESSNALKLVCVCVCVRDNEVIVSRDRKEKWMTINKSKPSKRLDIHCNSWNIIN